MHRLLFVEERYCCIIVIRCCRCTVRSTVHRSQCCHFWCFNIRSDVLREISDFWCFGDKSDFDLGTAIFSTFPLLLDWKEVRFIIFKFLFSISHPLMCVWLSFQTKKATFASLGWTFHVTPDEFLHLMKTLRQARNQLGSLGVFWEGRKFFKLCPIFFNYAQHIFPGGQIFCLRSPGYGPALRPIERGSLRFVRHW